MAVAPTTLTLVAGADWVCANAASAAAGRITLVPKDNGLWAVPGADGTTKPTTYDGAIEFRPPMAVAGRPISNVWAGATGQYIWLRSLVGATLVFASA